MNRLDLIIDALECALDEERSYLDKCEQALAAACELKALKPVGLVFDYFGTTVNYYSDAHFNQLKKYPNIKLQKLYALDEVTK
jgi:hypothetical protein